MQSFPHPKDATDKIWLKLANWSWRYNCLKVWKTTGDDKDKSLAIYYKLTLWAFGSGELKSEIFRVNSVCIGCIGPLGRHVTLLLGWRHCDIKFKFVLRQRHCMW